MPEHIMSENQEQRYDGLGRLSKPDQRGYWWWLPAYAAAQGNGHLPRWWTVVNEGPDTEKEGEFVGPLVAPVWGQDKETTRPGREDLIRRLRAAVAQMAPHVKERQNGALLVEALEALTDSGNRAAVLYRPLELDEMIQEKDDVRLASGKWVAASAAVGYTLRQLSHEQWHVEAARRRFSLSAEQESEQKPS